MVPMAMAMAMAVAVEREREGYVYIIVLCDCANGQKEGMSRIERERPGGITGCCQQLQVSV